MGYQQITLAVDLAAAAMLLFIGLKYYRYDRFVRWLMVVGLAYAAVSIPFYRMIAQLPWSFDQRLVLFYAGPVFLAITAGTIIGCRRRFIAETTRKAARLSEAGMHDEAVALVDSALSLTPDVAVLYFTRGQCREKAGQKENAEADFAKARELGFAVTVDKG
jgi:tetratricopeptide (TPR) repeat protein